MASPLVEYIHELPMHHPVRCHFNWDIRRSLASDGNIVILSILSLKFILDEWTLREGESKCPSWANQCKAAWHVGMSPRGPLVPGFLASVCILIVPSASATMSIPDNLVKEYQRKLIGKRISSSSSESSTVGLFPCPRANSQEFPESKLPPKHRIVGPGSLMTRDFHEDRYSTVHDRLT